VIPNLLIIDNNDSFTYNLVQIVREKRLTRFDVRKCKDISLTDISVYEKILISPGPGVPSDFPVLKELILRYKTEKSILGICLGHQAIAETFGLKLINMEKVTHGKRVEVFLTEKAGALFTGIPRRFFAGLYHSWVVAENDLEIFDVTATSVDGMIMGLSHNRYDILGLQFHPESYMTDHGVKILTNWLKK
jgi:anthranilate synthase component II